MVTRSQIRVTRPVFVFILALATFAQAPNTWQTATELPGLDQSGLSAQQKRLLISLLRSEGCNCGCTMKIAECRVRDPKCGRSHNLAEMAARELREGKSADAVRTELQRRMDEAPPLLDEAVSIPIDGDPVKGPTSARITLVEFSDFQ
jgi:hypothetical protein